MCCFLIETFVLLFKQKHREDVSLNIPFADTRNNSLDADIIGGPTNKASDCLANPHFFSEGLCSGENVHGRSEVEAAKIQIRNDLLFLCPFLGGKVPPISVGGPARVCFERRPAKGTCFRHGVEGRVPFFPPF